MISRPRKIRAIAVVGAAITLAAACGSNSGSKASSNPDDFHGEKLTVVMFGGDYQTNFEKYVVKPFEKKYNAKVSFVEGLTFDILAKMQAQKNNPQIDVWMMADPGAATAQQKDLIQPLDPAGIPNLSQMTERALPAGNPFVRYSFSSLVLAYNTDKVKTPPKTWSDLTNPAYKGHVVLPDINGCCGVLLLTTLGRQAGDVNNVTPAFQEIKSWKPDVLTYWTSHAQMQQLMTSGDGWVGVWASENVGRAALSGAPIRAVVPDTGSAIFASDIGLTKGTNHLKLAEAYINFAISQDVEQQMFPKLAVGPSNKNVTLPPNVQAFLPTGTALQNSYDPDFKFIGDQTAGWTEEWRQQVTG